MKRFIALVGAGYWGKNLLRNLYELNVLHTVCEVNKEIIDERKKTFPDVEYTSSYDEILANKEIKAVVIATPANKKRDEIQKKLKGKGIQTMIYYPVSLHQMKVFKIDVNVWED
ncbi:MAG TPA: hypothetical protein ENI51_02270 [Candidatus Atribacteria bacterium]|nr:hypothetical protein [Candidatus Atribacteria bacterium]